MLNNAILISETNGVVSHRFCQADEAQEALREAAKAGTGCSVMLQEENTLLDIADVFEMSPEVRRRVEAAKDKLRSDLRIQAALDKHGVPKDKATRSAVYAAFKELQSNPLH